MCDFKKTLLAIAFLLCTPGTSLAANIYTAEPPFLPAPVSPNILMTVDVSGSMSWSAYNPAADRTGWCGNSAGCGWAFAGTEEGNWIPDKKYKQSSGVWEETTSALQACPNRWSDIDSSKTYTGACLNFHLMSRIDLLRWAMVGGRPNVCTDGEYTSTDCDASIQAAASTTGYLTIHTIYDDKTKVPVSRIQDAVIPEFSASAVKPRLGLLFYSDSIKSQKVYVGDYPEGNAADATRPYTYFTRYLNARSVSGGTGTAAAMWEAYDYFKQADDHSFSNDFDMAGTSTKYRDPLYVCDYAKNDCGLVPCAKNFVILATDGQWNLSTSFSGTCSIDTGFTNNSADPVVPAYKMHHDVLRSVTSTSGTTYDKKVDGVYGLGLFMAPTGTGTLSLKNTAMYGGYDVASGGDWPGSLTGYPQGTCTMDDCGAGKGSGCTALPATTTPPSLAPDWDKDQNGIPDTFVNATDGAVLRSSLTAILSDILQRTAAGSSISVLTERATAGAVIHQALFFPTKTLTDGTNSYPLDWSGTLNAYWFFTSNTANNIREDNTNPLFLDTFDDNILDFTIDSSGSLGIDYYATDNFGGMITPKLGTYTQVDQIHKVFESGEKLRSRAASTRTIYGVNESGTLSQFTPANSASFDSLLDPIAGTDFSLCLGSTATARAQNIIDYIRGTADAFTTNTGVGNCRNRQVNNAGDRWKLGDIIHSSPTVVAHANYSMIYVSSNDGMLHAIQAGDLRKDGLSANQQVRLCEKATGDCFNTGNSATSNDIGKEAWAFIPKNAMPYLKYIADPNYKHIYTVDLAPYHIKHGSKEIIIGGMRFGGGTQAVLPPGCTDVATCGLGLSSYFALDVTDPTNPIFLWEFSDPGLGFSYSGPSYITRGTDHYVMFGSGPTNYRGEADGKDLRLFILKVDSDFKILDTFKIAGAATAGYAVDSSLASYNNGFAGRIFNNGMDWDNDNNTDLVFFGVNQKTGIVWSGNIMAVGPKTSTDTITGTTYTEPTDKNYGNTGAVKWSVGTVFQSAQSPVTSKVATGSCFGSPMLYFGTGRWFFKDDEPGKNVNDTESLHGISIKDCLEELQKGNNCNFNFSHSSTDVCTHIDDDQMGWVETGLDPKGGFYYKERTITDPTVTDYNIVFFTTMQPSSSSCDFGGRTRIWGMNCKSGHNIWSGCPGTNYFATVPRGSLLLQLSGGNIVNAGLTQSVFTDEDGKATDYEIGVPGGDPTPLETPGGLLNGELILWIER